MQAQATTAQAQKLRCADNRAGSSDATAEASGIEGKTVAFIPKLTGNAFFEVANDGAQEYAEKWGITVDYMGSSNAAVADQVSVINQAISSGVDAICISTVDAAVYLMHYRKQGSGNHGYNMGF